MLIASVWLVGGAIIVAILYACERIADGIASAAVLAHADAEMLAGQLKWLRSGVDDVTKALKPPRY
jgi:hypothetical protein